MAAEPIPPTTLTSLLVEWLDDAGQWRIDAHSAASAFSGALIWRITNRDQSWCLRQWPREHPPPDVLLAIHGLIRHAAEAGLDCVPTPLLSRSGHSFIERDGHLWELAPWLPGAPYDRRQPNPQRSVAALRALAELHVAAQSYACGGQGPAVGASPGLRMRAELLRGLQQGGLRELQLATAEPLVAACLDLAERVLPAATRWVTELVDVPLPLQWCLRDVKHDHVLFDGDRVSGLIDFGAAAVDSVAGDVARLVGSMTASRGEWPAAVDAYHARRPLSADERTSIDAFHAGGLVGAAANWARWLGVERRPVRSADAVRLRLAWLRERLEEAALRC